MKYVRMIAILMTVLIVSLPICFASSLSYDANGNLVSGDGKHRTYNEFNQLIKIRDGNTVSDPLMEEYFYDHTGLRKATLKYNSSGYNYEKVITPTREFMRISNDSGDYDFTYVYQGDTLVARKNSDGSVYYYHSDHLGSTSLLTDNDGNVKEQTFYTPFGKVDGSNPVEETKVGYTGHELDEDTGQVYMKARYYKPEFGIFTQPDTLLPNVFDPQQLNRYMYVGGSPYNRIDPCGKFYTAVIVFLLLVLYIFSEVHKPATIQKQAKDLGYVQVNKVDNSEITLDNSIETDNTKNIKRQGFPDPKEETIEGKELKLPKEELEESAGFYAATFPGLASGTINTQALTIDGNLDQVLQQYLSRGLVVERERLREKRDAKRARKDREEAIERLRDIGDCSVDVCGEEGDEGD